MINFPKIPSDEIAPVAFFSEDIEFGLTHSDDIIQWITNTIREEGKTAGGIQFIFCSDNRLLEINIEYLNHDTLTDIITFPYDDDPIEGDIYISIERIRENALTFNVSMEDELRRVIIHGILHLCGYGDKTPAEKSAMTAKEDYYLSKWHITK